ncbi:hypothetical protein [Bradyrhizobium sp. Leo170]|uniref:hypothetical protein n=1 Tax=Bradyrhizobium sp. Leo170 TaxID=1571199 RepID=UPI00102E6719|nr:hypothetical protein [Bradyrhizobium sp. Leo170]TAI61589.1 hypothetical protein CWO89_34365 [Bradyrhizobium sp. Leo170]
MNINIASQNQGLVTWAVAQVAQAVDIRHHVNFGITFSVVDDIATDAVFEVVAAPADTANPCNPGTFHPVQEVVSCDWLTAGPPNAKSEIVIPAGTKQHAICSATLPCKPDAFIKVMPVSGDTGKINVVVVLGGPR